jgi:hypothetical protein
VITLRTVENDAHIDTFVEIRRRINPESPLPREVVVEDQAKPEYLGLIAELAGMARRRRTAG